MKTLVKILTAFVFALICPVAIAHNRFSGRRHLLSANAFVNTITSVTHTPTPIVACTHSTNNA